MVLTGNINSKILNFFFSVALRPDAGHGVLLGDTRSHTYDNTPQSVGFLWTSDQPVTQTCT
jgi:hypothetical protein